MWKLKLYIYGAICIWFVALFTIFSNNITMREILFKERQALQLLNKSLKIGSKTPIRSVIVTRWLSGSSRLVRYFHHARGYYQHFSPLFNCKYEIKQPQTDIVEAIKNLHQLFDCDYNKSDNLLNVAKKHFTFYSLYGHQRRLCRKYPIYCWNKEFLSEICKIFPYQTIFVYDIRLREIGRMLGDNR
ncbi:uncharacterized protein LOC111591818 [Ceratitis capitata]|uniref:uncharacterized protein LOC111591818 n=1 Tax=Ceratitis capitata TaxID=7213 RepID=UPI000C6C8779|nr:uncharacterized protein LOC111591818 [Ceratitis capitata]